MTPADASVVLKSKHDHENATKGCGSIIKKTSLSIDSLISNYGMRQSQNDANISAGMSGIESGSRTSFTSPASLENKAQRALISGDLGNVIAKRSDEISKNQRPRRKSGDVSFNAFKLLKACNRCRKRKIKCVTKSFSNVCENCKNHGHECIFGHKVLNIKNKSMKEEISSISSLPIPEVGTKRLKNPSSSMKKLYVSNIEPYTPFVLHEIFEMDKLDKLSKCCINIANISSPRTQIPESTIEFLLEVFHNSLSEIDWKPCTLSCFFLLPLRIVVPQKIVLDSLKAFTEYLESEEELSPNLLIAALTIDAWNSLIRDFPLVTANHYSKLIESGEVFLGSLDLNSFNYHFLCVGVYLYKFQWMNQTNLQLRSSILQLEYDLLLWPAKLTRDFSVITDDLLASPEAFILHVVHNCLLIYFYSTLVKGKQNLGTETAIRAVPGLYNFIAGMARSNFRIKESIIGRWTIIGDSQVINARNLLELNEIMEFYEFKLALVHFNKKEKTNIIELQNSIYNQVRDMLENEKIHDDPEADLDGSKVYWVFRDVRSLCLSSLLFHDHSTRSQS